MVSEKHSFSDILPVWLYKIINNWFPVSQGRPEALGRLGEKIYYH